MTVDFKCDKCGKIVEELYFSFKEVPNDFLCGCGGKMKRHYGNLNFNMMGREIPGYEKENQDHLTLGKAIDKQKWF